MAMAQSIYSWAPNSIPFMCEFLFCATKPQVKVKRATHLRARHDAVCVRSPIDSRDQLVVTNKNLISPDPLVALLFADVDLVVVRAQSNA
jgi:hypothetical protein